MGEPVYPQIDLNFNGEFVGQSHTYNGDHFMFSDMDFAGMNYQQCIRFLERFTGSEFEKLYYCQRNRPLKTGIRFIQDDADYAHFLDEVYEDPDIPMSIYMDHSGDGLNDWFDSGSEVEDNAETEVAAEENVPEPGYMFGAGLVDEIAPDDFMVQLQKTREDEFLNKLCPEKGDIVGDEESEDEEDVQPEVGPRFDPDLHWKEQEPVLGMRFEDPKQLKSMLCNYAVRFGYQLCFQKNDRARLLAVCCKGDCTFRLWATWMSTEQSFQIKSLIGEHNCARNTKLGSLVTYQWIGSHYTKEILHRSKLTIRELRLEVIKKFGIDVSLSQCRRAKKHALNLIEGTLVEHYAKLWSYGEEIRRSNPGSTVVMDVEPMPDGKNYFSKYYVCFDGVKKGWMDGCRKVLGIDGCFLKGICTGELLCAVGKDANNQIYPVAWAVVCVENKENWKWFIDLLIDDLDLGRGEGLTVMSDQHKGLMEAMKEMLPHGEHRDPNGTGGGRHVAHETTEATLTGDNLGNTDNISRVLGVMRRKKSERILKKKLAKRVQGVNGEGNCMETPMPLD